MPRSKRWKKISVEKGIYIMQLSSWKYFHDFVTQQMLNYSHYVWRGDRCDNRALLPSFDRQHIGKSQSFIENKTATHLKKFKEAARGRRGINPPKPENENGWWALGQHHGLKTPLLDWTHSAFVALFFAFERVKKPQTKNRTVYAISPDACEKFTDKIRSIHKNKSTRADYVEFFTPMQDENSKLVNQNGLFSRCSAGKPLDHWVREKYHDNNKEGIILKILIPDSGRQECLRTLNKMNINYLTLFPDLYGASNYVNMLNSIKKY